jgi:hypothetical protein
VLVRQVDMRGVDLRIFDFDYDLTWAAFFLNHRGHIYGRYGGRDEGPAERGLSLKGLKAAMRRALDAFEGEPDAAPEILTDRLSTPEEYPAAARLKGGECIHCHMVYDFRREQLRREKKWTRDNIWVYPPPENIGLSLDVDLGDRLKAVKSGSAAARAGLDSGDRLLSVSGRAVASYGDLQYALHRAPARGEMEVVFERGTTRHTSRLALEPGWRESDISWRGSMWGLPPTASVYGEDLKPDEKKKLSVGEKQLAFRQGDYVPPPASAAGIRAKDVIVGIDGRRLEMTMLQFNAWVRLNHQVGERIVFDVIRDGKRLRIPMVLAEKDW